MKYKALFFSAILFLLFVSSCTKENKSKETTLIPETEIVYSEKPVSVITFDSSVNQDTNKPDIDLTVMSATMIYSTVFQFLIDWESYEGKIIRIRGLYTPFFRQENNRVYHNVVIQDATACCKEGLEFVWGDGSHEAGEYPQEGTEIIVQGVFEQYYEDDKMEVMQIHLKDAIMEIIQ